MFYLSSLPLIESLEDIILVLEWTKALHVLSATCFNVYFFGLVLRPKNSTNVVFAQQGFDEFMNVVMDDAAEVYLKEQKQSRDLGEYYLCNWLPENYSLKYFKGRILLKGDNITLIQPLAS